VNGEELLRPLLGRYPDARLAKAPLVDPLLLPYLGLIGGSVIAALVAAYNAVMLRRPALAAYGLAIGAAAWIVTRFLVAALLAGGVHNAGLLVLAIRLLHFAAGGVLYAMQQRHVKGHELLHGVMVPVQLTYILAFAAGIYVPWKLRLALMGLPNV
jgi:hypothetical protein